MKKILLFLICLCSFVQAEANAIEPVKEGPVHEAFLIQENGNAILEAVPNQPPPQITEIQPSQEDTTAIWISGYWAWSTKKGRYLWVSGTWRRPPPNHQWVEGYWKQYPEGWVWIRGFWRLKNGGDLKLTSQPPPGAIDEKVSDPPAPADGYFWVPGIWQYRFKEKKYVWYSGRWEVLDDHWVYVPGQYLWREKGYVYVPGFWDWPIEERGVAFSSVYIEPQSRATAVYTPTDALDPLFIMELYFPHWPDYRCLYRYHYAYHYNLWVTWGAAPTWWNWWTWWCLPWQDSWWLWWWWTHPGYPNPSWINAELANKIEPPPAFVVKMMQKIKASFTVTANGAIGEKTLIEALQKVSGKKKPILPSDPKQIQQIQEVADPSTPTPPYLRPNGKEKIKTPPQKPFFGPSKTEMKSSPERIIVPERPVGIPSQNKAPETTNLPSKPYKVQYQPAAPRTNQPQTQRQPYESQSQGNIPQYSYPQTPMQLQHQDRIMTYPQPQRNPSGPKVYQFPDDASTNNSRGY